MAAVGCEKAPIETDVHGEYTIELLFEKDGCKMYRFNDGGRNVYWSNCQGNTATSYRSGKTTYYADVYTNAR